MSALVAEFDRIAVRPRAGGAAGPVRGFGGAMRGASVELDKLKDLTVMNTTASEFWGYPKDGYTTLPETKDRILATSVNAAWRFRPGAAPDWDAAFAMVDDVLQSAQSRLHSALTVIYLCVPDSFSMALRYCGCIRC